MRDIVSPRLVLTRGDVDGLASALVIREAIGAADVRVCGEHADPLLDVLARVDERRCDELWIADLFPPAGAGERFALEKMRLTNGAPWIYWLDRHRWPPEKKMWFRQLSKVKVINDPWRRTYEIAATACFPIPRPAAVLAVCAAAYRMPAPDGVGAARLWARLKSLSHDTEEAHRAAEAFLEDFAPSPLALAGLVAEDPSDFSRVPADRIAVLGGPPGAAIVQVDLRDGVLGDLTRERARELVGDAQRARSAQGAVLIVAEDRVHVGTSEYRLPGAAAKVALAFADRVIEARGKAQIQAIRFADDRAALEVAPFLAGLPPERAARYDPATPEGTYAAGIADFYEGRPDAARERLTAALATYAQRERWDESIPRHLAGIPVWPLRAEAALYCLRQY
jgi:hypothetical protein